MYFPHYCRFEFNTFHRDSFEEFRPGTRSLRRARGAPRGYAKSTFKALIELVHDVCYGNEDFVVVISNTQSQANGKLKDIRREVLTNDLLVEHYGISFPRSNPGETSFVVDCDGHETMFAAYGAGAEIRGIRFGAKRPTKIVCDDVEHSEEVFNEELRQKYRDWYFEVVSQIGDTETNIEFVGTVLHRQSLLVELLNNPGYNTRLYKSIISWSERQDLWEKWKSIYTNLDDQDRAQKSAQFYSENEAELLRGTKVLWPEKEPYLYLMKEMVEKGRRAFMKEKQNEPLGSAESVFDMIHWYRETEGEYEGKKVPGILIERSGKFIPMAHLRAYGVLDPSTGQVRSKKGKLGDYSCLLTGLKDPQGRLLVHSDWTKREAPTKYIAQIFEHHLVHAYEQFGVETNLYRNLLLPNIIAERSRRERDLKKVIQIPFYDIENVDNKEKRIYTLEPKVTHGWILFNRNLSETFMNMLYEFPHAEHDDGPDALEMLWGLVNNRYKAAAMSINPMGGR